VGTIQGEFEHLVLLSTMRLGDEAFTAAIVEELETRTGREVAPPAVYVALRRLEKKGLARSALRRNGDTGAVRERRFFAVTAAGLEALRESRRHLTAMWSGFEDDLGEVAP